MQHDPSLEGEPQYVPEMPAEHTYAYGPPDVAPPVRRCDPRIGWGLVAVGLLATFATFLPWFHFVTPVSPDQFGSVVVGEQRGSFATVLLSLAVLAAGAWISRGRGDLWSPVGALVASALSILFQLLSLAGETVFNAFAFDNESTITIAYGFWLEGAVSVTALALSILALAGRRPVR